ncbi:Inner membrane transport protein YnfM [compost metagenome]
MTLLSGSARARLRFNLAMLLAGVGAFALLYVPQPLLPLLTERFAIGAAEAGLAVALTSGAMAVGILAGGLLCGGLDRRKLMALSLLLAALLTFAAGLASDWRLLLGLRILTGLALAGVPAVAMAHISAEARGQAMGGPMGLYVAGTGLGGVAGRLGASFAADLLDWRWGFGLMGLAGMGLAAAFFLLLPSPAASVDREKTDARKALQDMLGLMKDRALLLLYLQAFLFMGVFLTAFTFVGFHLGQAPFFLSQAAIGSIFLLFLIGSVSSAVVGWLTGRLGRERLLPAALALMACGVVLTLTLSTPLFLVGLTLLVIGFFGAHAVASSWVSGRAVREAGLAAALYLFFYHLGSAVVSAVGGLAWQAGGWTGMVAYLLALCLTALGASLVLHRRGRRACDGEVQTRRAG